MIRPPGIQRTPPATQPFVRTLLIATGFIPGTIGMSLTIIFSGRLQELPATLIFVLFVVFCLARHLHSLQKKRRCTTLQPPDAQALHAGLPTALWGVAITLLIALYPFPDNGGQTIIWGGVAGLIALAFMHGGATLAQPWLAYARLTLVRFTTTNDKPALLLTRSVPTPDTPLKAWEFLDDFYIDAALCPYLRTR